MSKKKIVQEDFFSKLVDIFRIIGHVAAALGPIACAGRSARPRHVAASLGVLAAMLGPESVLT